MSRPLDSRRASGFDTGRDDAIVDAEPPVHNEFTAVFERDGEWVIAYCPEIPGANGRGSAVSRELRGYALVVQQRVSSPSCCTARRPFEMPSTLERPDRRETL